MSTLVFTNLIIMMCLFTSCIAPLGDENKKNENDGGSTTVHVRVSGPNTTTPIGSDPPPSSTPPQQSTQTVSNPPGEKTMSVPEWQLHVSNDYV